VEHRPQLDRRIRSGSRNGPPGSPSAQPISTSISGTGFANLTFGPRYLDNPVLASLIIRNPTANQLEAACSQALPVAYGRALQRQARSPSWIAHPEHGERQHSGARFTTNYTALWAPGALKLSLDGTYLFHFHKQDEPGAPSQQLLDTQNNPLS